MDNKSKERTVNINNFIAVYDNYITKEECNYAIELYENQNKFNRTLSRIDFEHTPVLQKQDQQYFMNRNNINVSQSRSPSVGKVFCIFKLVK